MARESFDYTYSSKEDKELQKIKDKYRLKTSREMKMEELLALDKSVTRNATIAALTLGILGTLIFGVGMTCVTVWTSYFVVGIFIGILGLLISAISYPIYMKMVKNRQDFLAPQILQLTEEIEKGEN